MQKTARSPEDYINSLPEERQKDLNLLHDLIKSVSPKTKPYMYEGKFWGGSDQKIIAYGHYTYVNSQKKEVDWSIIGLAQQKNYITVFVNAVEDRQYLAEKYKDKIGKAKVGKSSISFNKVEDINLDVLKEMVARAFELMQN